MSIANYLENKVLDKVLKNTDFTVSTVYVALHTADPGEAGTNAEVTGTNGVSRVSCAFNSASGGTSTNSADATFAAASGNLGTVTHISLWDASTSGNCLWSGALTSSQAVPVGVSFRLPAGQLSVSLD